VNVTTYNPADGPNEIPSYDGDPAMAWKYLIPGCYPAVLTNDQGIDWRGELVITEGGTFSHFVPGEPDEAGEPEPWPAGWPQA
jgi:hypothetical protein